MGRFGDQPAREVLPADSDRAEAVAGRDTAVGDDRGGDRGCSSGGLKSGMTAKDFRRIALSLEGAEEGSHMGAVDFRVGGRIFATLAAVRQGYGNVMLTPEQQAEFVGELPEVFVPIAGGWGRNGATHIRLAAANEDVVTGALQAAWKVRVEKNAKVGKKKPAAKRRG